MTYKTSLVPNYTNNKVLGNSFYTAHSGALITDQGRTKCVSLSFNEDSYPADFFSSEISSSMR